MKFMDLKKAYDFIPQEALWQVLKNKKCSVPPRMLRIIKSFHEGICAEVSVGHAVINSFEVRNDLRQGCTMILTLFNCCSTMVKLLGYTIQSHGCIM